MKTIILNLIHTVLTLVYTAPYSIVGAQGLSIELSIEWQKPSEGLKVDANLLNGKTLVPFLRVKYCNHTTDSIYFREVVSLEGGMPIVVVGGSRHADPDLNKLAQNLKRAKLNYDVHVRQHETTVVQAAWEILKRDQPREIEHEIDIINDDLADFYDLIKLQKKLNELQVESQLSGFNYPGRKIVSYREANRIIYNREQTKSNQLYFDESELTEMGIAGKYSNRFIFMCPGESQSKEIELMGFAFIGGSFRFLILDKNISNFLMGKNGAKILLPKKINHYKLYVGSFYTNSVGLHDR